MLYSPGKLHKETAPPQPRRRRRRVACGKSLKDSEGNMSAYVEVVSRRELAVKIHYWAQDILRNNRTCGLGKTPEGKYQVVWPGLINQWIYCPNEHGQYLGTLDRKSGTADVEHMLAGEE
jgi:hypothetical protein